MARRRAKRSWVHGQFARTVAGIVLLGLLWGAYQLGLVDHLTEALIAPLQPD